MREGGGPELAPESPGVVPNPTMEATGEIPPIAGEPIFLSTTAYPGGGGVGGSHSAAVRRMKGTRRNQPGAQISLGPNLATFPNQCLIYVIPDSRNRFNCLFQTPR